MSVAVIIPVRNRPAAVARAIRSVQAQTRPVDRILIVDDASTDDTPAVVMALAKEDPRVALIALPERGGAAAARNRGVLAAREDWIAFLDSDDEWLPRKIEWQMAALAATDGAIASFTGHIGVHDEVASAVHILPRHVRRRSLLGSNMLGTTSSAMVQRDTLLAVGGFDESLRSCQDWELWVRLQAAGGLALVPAPLVLFHQGGADRITRDLDAVLAGHRLVFPKLLAAADGPLARRYVRSLHRLRLAQIMAWDFDRPGPAIREAALALLQWPGRGKARFLAGLIRRRLAGR